MTVEEGERAILECPGFVPGPDNSTENFAIFNWYKARQSDIGDSNKVAFYEKGANLRRTAGDLLGRASIDGISGALEIHETKITDDHFYTCDFRDTAKGRILNGSQLTIKGKTSFMCPLFL